MESVVEVAYRVEARKIVKDGKEAEKIVKALKDKGFDVCAKEIVFEF